MLLYRMQIFGIIYRPLKYGTMERNKDKKKLIGSFCFGTHDYSLIYPVIPNI